MRSGLFILILCIALSSCDTNDSGKGAPIADNSAETLDVEWIPGFGFPHDLIAAQTGTRYRLESDRVLHSTDGGVSWTTTVSVLPDGWLEMIYPAAVTPDGQIIVGLLDLTIGDGVRARYHGLARSSDGGATFIEITPDWLGPQNVDVFLSRVIGDAFGNVFVEAYGDYALYRSSDVGDTWSKVFDDFECCAVISFSTDGTVYMLGQRKKVYVSQDLGLNWSSMPDGPFEDVLDIDFLNEQNIYLLGGNFVGGLIQGIGSVFHTPDRGNSWSRLFLPRLTMSVRSLAIGANGHIFVSVDDLDFHYVYRSIDGGETWEEISDGLPKNLFDTVDGRVRLMLDDWGYLYASVGPSVFRTSERLGGIR